MTKYPKRYRLSHFTGRIVETRDNAYYTSYIDKAFNHLIRDNLRMDNARGVVSVDSMGWIEKPSGYTHTPVSPDEAWEHYFARHIRSTAARFYNLANMKG